MKTVINLLIILLLAAGPTLGEEAAVDSDAPQYDLTGRWKVLLSNSISRKQVTFDLAQADGRPRGKMLSKEMEEQDLDGRIDKDNKVFFWGTFRDRTGRSYEYEFKGKVEGEPGEEKFRGRARYFNKSYDFVGVRAR